MEENGKKIIMAEDIASLKVEVRNIHERMGENHNVLVSEFQMLRAKVNEEITTMQSTIKSDRKTILRILWLSLAAGSFLWVKESREWILNNIFRF